jgi:hypothetical protein
VSRRERSSFRKERQISEEPKDLTYEAKGCNKSGHTEDRCWKLHTELRPKRGRSKQMQVSHENSDDVEKLTATLQSSLTLGTYLLAGPLPLPRGEGGTLALCKIGDALSSICGRRSLKRLRNLQSNFAIHITQLLMQSRSNKFGSTAQEHRLTCATTCPFSKTSTMLTTT